jgi:hypothetical protein
LKEEPEASRAEGENTEPPPITDSEIAEVDIDITRLLDDFEIDFVARS